MERPFVDTNTAWDIITWWIWRQLVKLHHPLAIRAFSRRKGAGAALTAVRWCMDAVDPLNRRMRQRGTKASGEQVW